ncbi:uncharacterized protein LOC128132881 [Lactuca sativa]|uniref:uncharacterized protein LOC128132881 n=1 Tax=Lactuca sativa TaxID=4236 RepID=UPI0022AE6885|nr:uncharacterized protein LOC128132881 [Lactuca sativa]
MEPDAKEFTSMVAQIIDKRLWMGAMGKSDGMLSCTTAKEIWDRLKELYSTDEDLEHSIQTLLLSEFGAFVQKPEEKLIQTFDHFNHLLSKMMKPSIERKVIEQNDTLMNGLRPEWIAVVSTVKAHEQFKSYSLAKLMGILKSHESEVTKEAKVVSGVGSLALVYKRKNVVDEEEQSDMSECDLTNEEYTMMVTNPKKFARRKFPANKNRNWQGSYNSEKVKEEPKNNTQKDDEKKESKLENIVNDEFDGVEVWSIDSEDEEVRTPSHGRAYVAREGVVVSAGRCLMITTESKHEKEKVKEDKCFAAKPMSEKISDCDQLIKKEDEIIAECESIMSLDEISVTYKYGLDKIESFIESKEQFIKNEPEPTKPLISENSVEYARVSKEKSKTLKEKAIVYQKVQTTPNQVYKVTGVTKKPTAELTSMVDKDNAEGCDNFFCGCSRHMTRRSEELREFRSLKDGGCVKYGNNSYSIIKGYGMITNGEFSIRKVAYVEGLQHNLISISQLFAGTSLKVSFDDEGSKIIEKQMKKILLKSERKGEIFPLNLNLIKGKLEICLLSKANTNESWLWHRRLSHLNFKDINQLVLGDHVRGLPILKFDKEHLCAA